MIRAILIVLVLGIAFSASPASAHLPLVDRAHSGLVRLWDGYRAKVPLEQKDAKTIGHRVNGYIAHHGSR